MFMNEWEIEEEMNRYQNHPVIGKATRFLRAFVNEVNAHSDGWPYWSRPLHAAERLMRLIKDGQATEQDLRKALTPIKAFMTRHGNAAGMTMPRVS
jgi:hypothetical protein